MLKKIDVNLKKNLFYFKLHLFKEQFRKLKYKTKNFKIKKFR